MPLHAALQQRQRLKNLDRCEQAKKINSSLRIIPVDQLSKRYIISL